MVFAGEEGCAEEAAARRAAPSLPAIFLRPEGVSDYLTASTRPRCHPSCISRGGKFEQQAYQATGTPLTHLVGTAGGVEASAAPGSPSSGGSDGGDGGTSPGAAAAACQGQDGGPAAAAGDVGGGGAREDWMTTPMGRPLAAAPSEPGKPDRHQEAESKAAIAAVSLLSSFQAQPPPCHNMCCCLQARTLPASAGVPGLPPWRHGDLFRIHNPAGAKGTRAAIKINIETLPRRRGS